MERHRADSNRMAKNTRNAKSEDVATLRRLGSPLSGATIEWFEEDLVDIYKDCLWDSVRFNKLSEDMFYGEQTLWELIQVDHHFKCSS